MRPLQAHGPHADLGREGAQHAAGCCQNHCLVGWCMQHSAARRSATTGGTTCLLRLSLTALSALPVPNGLQEYAGACKVVKMEADDNKPTLEEYKVYGLPCFILFQDGAAVPGSFFEG